MAAPRLINGMTIDELLEFHRATFGDMRMEAGNGESGNDGNNSGTTSTADDTPKTITLTSQQLADRLARAKPADYDDLKAKAARLDELEQANKSEVDKAKDEAAKAVTERDAAKAEALRLRIAVEHKITLEDADLFLTGTTEETLRAQAKRLSDREADRKRNGGVVPTEGKTPSAPTGDEMRAYTRKLFERAD